MSPLVCSGTSALRVLRGHRELGFMRPLGLHCCDPLGSGPQADHQVALMQPKVLLWLMPAEIVLHFFMGTTPSVHPLQQHLTHKASAESKSLWRRSRSYIQTWLTIRATLTMSWIPRCSEEPRTSCLCMQPPWRVGGEVANSGFSALDITTETHRAGGSLITPLCRELCFLLLKPCSCFAWGDTSGLLPPKQGWTRITSSTVCVSFIMEVPKITEKAPLH